MELKLTGKILDYRAPKDSNPILTIVISGKDSNGGEISGEVKLQTTARAIRDVKLNDFIEIRLATKME